MTIRYRLYALVALFTSGILGSLVAQEAASVVYAEGDAFTIIRNSGTEERHTWRDADFIGAGLGAGDMVLTDDDTYLELRINSNGSVVRVSENTSFRVTGTPETGDTRLAVTYGRVRAAVNTLRGDEAFTIRGRSVVAGVRGTDFGVSVIATRAGEVRDTIFVLEGEVAVQPRPPEQIESSADDSGAAPDEPEIVLVSAGNLVSVASPNDPIEVKAIDAIFRAEIERDSFRTPILRTPAPGRAPNDGDSPSLVRPGAPVDPEDEPEREPSIDEQVYRVETAPRSLVLRLQSGGGFLAAAGADLYLGSGRVRTGIVAGGTLLAEDPTPAVAFSAAFEPQFGRFVTSFGATSYLTADTEDVTAAVGASLGVGLRFNRVLRELFLDNTIYFNAYPDAELPLVYMPAIGVRL